MKRIRKQSAGIDIGSKQIFVAIEGQAVKSFDTFTEDFEKASAYLLAHNIETVAMEATGVYWVILYDILRSAGLDVWLVDGRSTKQVPGRKTDVKDCQWIQQLHSYGLLNKCFIPEPFEQELRAYQRLREDHIRSASMHINHMQKALTLMNIRLKEVLSQIHGSSGLKIIRSILAGERNPESLVKLCHSSILKTKKDKVLKALNGHYSSSGLFELEQALSCYDFYMKQIRACDKKIEIVLKAINKNKPDINLKNNTRKPIRHHKPEIKNLGKYLMEIFNGRDATKLPGITDYNWLKLLCELGTDLSKWKTQKHFTSWLTLAPKQHNSGKMKKNYKAKGNAKAGLIFRNAAVSIIESKKIALGAFGRKIRARKGPAVAIKAVARKLAELYWKLMVNGLDYVEKGIRNYEQKILENKKKVVSKLAKELGMVIHYDTAT
jgi:transposase